MTIFYATHPLQEELRPLEEEFFIKLLDTLNERFHVLCDGEGSLLQWIVQPSTAVVLRIVWCIEKSGTPREQKVQYT